jgi:hypothetical protein
MTSKKTMVNNFYVYLDSEYASETIMPNNAATFSNHIVYPEEHMGDEDWEVAPVWLNTTADLTHFSQTDCEVRVLISGATTIVGHLKSTDFSSFEVFTSAFRELLRELRASVEVKWNAAGCLEWISESAQLISTGNLTSSVIGLGIGVMPVEFVSGQSTNVARCQSLVHVSCNILHPLISASDNRNNTTLLSFPARTTGSFHEPATRSYLPLRYWFSQVPIVISFTRARFEFNSSGGSTQLLLHFRKIRQL